MELVKSRIKEFTNMPAANAASIQQQDICFIDNSQKDEAVIK
jgi:CheY-specific phosphatase CheX